MDNVICKELIVSNIARRGMGKKYSPIRVVTQVYEKDGTLVAENDPYDEKFVLFDLINFARRCIEKGIKADDIHPKEVYEWLDSIK